MKTRKIFIGALLAISSFFVSTAFLPSSCLSQEVSEKTDVKIKTIKDVDAVLSTVTTYEYGMSRESLTQLTDFERSIYGEPKTLKELEKKYVKFLKSDASLAGKQFVCRRLSVIGSDESVSVLASLLLDPQTSNMARYALERVQSEQVVSALHKVLPKANGDVKIGIINTLGEKGDQKSVPVIAPFIYENDPSIASATAAALGKIADQQAIDVLAVAKDKTSGKIEMLFWMRILNVRTPYWKRIKMQMQVLFINNWIVGISLFLFVQLHSADLFMPIYPRQARFYIME